MLSPVTVDTWKMDPRTRTRSSLYECAQGSSLYTAPRKNINPSTRGDHIQEEIAVRHGTDSLPHILSILHIIILVSSLKKEKIMYYHHIARVHSNLRVFSGVQRPLLSLPPSLHFFFSSLYTPHPPPSFFLTLPLSHLSLTGGFQVGEPAPS